MPRIVKALSVKQPWANLIASGEKTIETRTWGTDFRGEMLVVSSKKPSISPAGCGLALVRVLDCRPMTKADEQAACCKAYAGAYSWVLELVTTVDPFPVRGRLGLFEVEIDDPREIRNGDWTASGLFRPARGSQRSE